MRSLINAIISVIIFGLLYCFTAIGVVIVIVLSLFGMKKTIIMLMQLWAKAVFRLVCRQFTVHGLENINEKERYILVANHASLFDIVAIVTFYPDISWLGHERLLRVPVFRRILKITDYVPAGEANYRNTKRMVQQLASKSQHNSVAIFPEGTRTLDGKINRFYRGFIHLFRTMDLGILPVTLNGFYDLKPKTRMSINLSSRLDVVIHKPLSKTDLEGKCDSEISDLIRKIIISDYHLPQAEPVTERL
jgi:1-acyl-sn-glycerol-3-phosphate acyltransferase